MNGFVKQVVDLLTQYEFLSIKSVLLVGSKVQPETVDFWSDTDLVIVLKPQGAIEKDAIENRIRQIGEIIGKEEYLSENSLLLRLVIEIGGNIERIDLKVCTYRFWQDQENSNLHHYQLLYGDQVVKNPDQTKSNSSPGKIRKSSEKIDQIWFLLYECVKKFMRGDHLIGLHLLLELIQEYLILLMEKRDAQLKINFHRTGNKEQLPKDLALSEIACHDRKMILHYLESLSNRFDNHFKQETVNYKGRMEPFRKYLKASEKHF